MRFSPPTAELDDDERTEKWAWLLLNRYGVVFFDLLNRENAAPAWSKCAGHFASLKLKVKFAVDVYFRTPRENLHDYLTR